MNPKTITDPDVVPVISLEDCRTHLRVTPDDDSPPSHPDDGLILAQLSAARDWVEGYTGLALTPRTLELALDHFPSDDDILLPIPPTISVTSIVYTDSNGADQTVSPDDYVLDTYQRPGWVVLASGASWPTPMDVINAVLVRYVVGYSLWNDDTPAERMPKGLHIALLLILGMLYENREEGVAVKTENVPLGALSFCDLYRIRRGLA